VALTVLSLVAIACSPATVGEGTTTGITSPTAETTTTTAAATPLTLAASDLTIPPRYLTERGEPVHLDFIANCLRDEGFDVEVDYEQQSIGSYIRGQEQAYDEALDRCQQAAVDAGLDIPFAFPTRKELILTYRVYERIEACMIEHGYPVPPKPSLEQFVDSGGKWDPTDIIYRSIDLSRQRQLEADCNLDYRDLFAQVIADLREQTPTP